MTIAGLDVTARVWPDDTGAWFALGGGAIGAGTDAGCRDMRRSQAVIADRRTHLSRTSILHHRISDGRLTAGAA